MSDRFEIAHLSDLHVTAHPDDRRSEPKFKRLGGMNKACRHVLESEPVQEANLVLITGDVTDKSDLEAWHNVNRMLVETRVKSKTLMVAGNHDVCGLGARFGWPPSFEREDLEKVRAGLKIVGQPLRYPWVKPVDPRVVVFGLDSNNAGNWTPIDNAVGRLGTKQLDKFEEQLAMYKDAPVKIVALHHSPNIPHSATAIRRGQVPKPIFYRLTMQMDQYDRRRLRDICRSNNVRMILHGHLHQAEDRRVNSVRIIGAPATTQPVKGKGSARRYEIWRYSVLGHGGRVIRKLVEI